MRILWLGPKSGVTQYQKMILGNLFKIQGLSISDVFFIHTYKEVPHPYQQVNRKWVCLDKQEEIRETVDKFVKIAKPGIIILNDTAALHSLTQDIGLTLNKCRGSVYRYRGIPCICLDNLALHNENVVKYGLWILAHDIAKVSRWAQGKQRSEPKFTYTVCRTLQDVKEAEQFLTSSICFAEDIETKGRIITCIGFCGLQADGSVHSYVIPFYNSSDVYNNHWDELEEIEAWRAVQRINASEVPKIFQNGQYDCVHLIRHGAAPHYYFLDSMHLFRALWVEPPKRLDFIASLFMDFVAYWKEERKGTKDYDQEEREADRDQERYWRYCAYDNYATMMSTFRLLSLVTKQDYGLANYNREIRLQLGPALAATMRGMKLDRRRHKVNKTKWLTDYEKGLERVRTLIADPDYNPNSPQQTAELLYDILGAQTVKFGRTDYGRSSNEKVLVHVQGQHPIFARVIDAIWEAKKPRNNHSKYGDIRTYFKVGDVYRFLYTLSAAATETYRFGSKEHALWVGTNAQNVPDPVRSMFVADPGYLLFEPDYSQSDAYYVAFESEDEGYIANVLSDKDTHCVHAAFFFGLDYDTVYKGYKAKDPKYAHPVKGIRAITKRIVHGANYQMAGMTLFLHMGRDAVIAAAEFMGHTNAAAWGTMQLINFCDKVLLEKYHELYPRLRPWYGETIRECIGNSRKLTAAYGETRLFFGNIAKDKRIQRIISAYFGQTGTAGNINRVLLEAYYGTSEKSWDSLDSNGAYITTQTHDSIMWQLAENEFRGKADQILRLMDQPVTIKGRSFSVPTEGKIGRSWGGGLIAYSPDLTLADIDAHEASIEQSYVDLAESLGIKDQMIDLAKELEEILAEPA